jgi:hypothetical protein
MRCAEHEALMQKRQNAFKIVVGNNKEKMQLGLLGI